MTRLLLLSNSTNYQESYMQWCKSIIASFLKEKDKQNIVFIPYAAVGFSNEEYTQKVNTALASVGVQVLDLSNSTNEIELLEQASAIFVGGGNTFHLLKSLQDLELAEKIKEKINSGTPYVGWSAGSNIAGPTICTTNDMPIVEPCSFRALEFIPWQINPHFTYNTIPNHGGETREQRLNEYLAANPNQQVVCLPEASFLMADDTSISYFGNSKGILLNAHNKIALEDSSHTMY